MLPWPSDNGEMTPPSASSLPPPPPLTRMPPSQPPQQATDASPISEESWPDPVLNFVGDMMDLMSKFAASYKSGISQNTAPMGQPATLHPASQQVDPSMQSSQQQSKRPRIYSPDPIQKDSADIPLPNQLGGTSRQSIQPTTEWLGDTQEDLAQQLEEMNNYSNDMEADEDMENGISRPFPSSNLSERLEPLFTGPRRAWISAQITSHLNDVSDELHFKLNTTNKKLEEATKLINSQNDKIKANEMTISELKSVKDSLHKEVDELKQKVNVLENKSFPQPASRHEYASNPANESETSLTVDKNTVTRPPQPSFSGQVSSQQEESPPLPKPSQPSRWAESWASFIQKPNQIKQQKTINQPPKTAKQIKIEHIIYDGNRTVGFKPMSRRRVKQFETEPEIAHLPPKDREEAAKRLAIKDFLKHEMLFSDETIEELTIDKIFFPRNNDAKILYVRFANPKIRAKVTAKASLLQPNEEFPSMTPMIVKYIPPEIFNRFKALESYSYQLRNNESNPLNTNIRFGKDDLELRVRHAKNNDKYDENFKPDPWQFIAPTPLPELPAIDLNRERQPVIRPPGRRLVPTPPPSPLPVPENLLAMDDMDVEDQPLGRTSPAIHSPQEGLQIPATRQKSETNNDKDDVSFFKKPLPVRHSTFPSALNTERELLLQSSSSSPSSSSSSSIIERETAPAPVNESQSCQ